VKKIFATLTSLLLTATAVIALSGGATAATASVACSTLPTNPTTVTLAMAQAAATCTQDGAQALTTRQCPAINQQFPTGSTAQWLPATTFYLYPGTPDTCDTRAAVQEFRNLACPAAGTPQGVRVQWQDSNLVTHYAPVNGAAARCYAGTVFDETQYVISAGFPTYPFYLKLNAGQGGAFNNADCFHYPCVALLRK